MNRRARHVASILIAAASVAGAPLAHAEDHGRHWRPGWRGEHGAGVWVGRRYYAPASSGATNIAAGPAAPAVQVELPPFRHTELQDPAEAPLPRPRFALGATMGTLVASTGDLSNRNGYELGLNARVRLVAGLWLGAEVARVEYEQQTTTSATMSRFDSQNRIGGQAMYDVHQTASESRSEFVAAQVGVESNAAVSGGIETHMFSDIGAGIRFSLPSSYEVVMEFRVGHQGDTLVDYDNSAQAVDTYYYRGRFGLNLLF